MNRKKEHCVVRKRQMQYVYKMCLSLPARIKEKLHCRNNCCDSLNPTQKLRTTHRGKIKRKGDVAKISPVHDTQHGTTKRSVLWFRLLNLVRSNLYILHKYITKIGEIGEQKCNNDFGRVWERLTGSPGSLPPRILKPNPVSFLHRKMSCSWKSGTRKSTNYL